MSVPDSERVRSKMLLTLFSKHRVKGYNKSASKEKPFKGEGIPCQN